MEGLYPKRRPDQVLVGAAFLYYHVAFLFAAARSLSISDCTFDCASLCVDGGMARWGRGAIRVVRGGAVLCVVVVVEFYHILRFDLAWRCGWQQVLVDLGRGSNAAWDGLDEWREQQDRQRTRI